MNDMILFKVDNTYTFFNQIPDDIYDDIKEMLMYIDPDFHFKQMESIKKYQKQKNTKMIEWMRSQTDEVNLLDEKQNRFPTGLLNSVLMYLKLKGYDYLIKNIPSSMKHENGIQKMTIDNYELFNDQKEIMDKIIENDYKGIVVAATNFGKTIIGLEMINNLKVKTLIVSPRKHINQQWADDLKKSYGDDSHYKSDGSTHYFFNINNETLDILITTPTMINNYFSNRKVSDKNKQRNKQMKDFILLYVDFLIYDEVHTAGSDTGIDALDSIPVKHKIGLTGTYGTRSDNKDLHYTSYFGDVICNVDNDRQIELNRSVKPIIKFIQPPYIHFSRKSKWMDVFQEAVVHNIIRNTMIESSIYNALENDRNAVLVLVDRIEHIEMLVNKNPDMFVGIHSDL